jgi:hypothetical protein
MPTANTRHPLLPAHTEVGATTPLDLYGNPNTLDNPTLNLNAVGNNFWHLVIADPNQPVAAATATAPYGAGVTYEPLQADLLKLPVKHDVVVGPAAACAATCKEQAKLRETECDKLRARVIQALKEGHCPSKITGIRKLPCGVGTKKNAPKKKSAKSKK